MNALLTLLLLSAAPQEAEAPVTEAPAAREEATTREEPTAQEEAAPVVEPEMKLEATTTGYVDSRFSWSHVSPVGLVPATGVPALANLSEAEVREVRSGTDRATLLTLDPLASDGEGLGSTLADSSPRPEDALIAAERMGYLRDAIAELPERLRIVVSGYYLQQRPLTEIAEELGVTQSRASQLRSEGLDLLREALESLLGEGRRGRTRPEDDTSRPAGVSAVTTCSPA